LGRGVIGLAFRLGVPFFRCRKSGNFSGGLRLAAKRKNTLLFDF